MIGEDMSRNTIADIVYELTTNPTKAAVAPKKSAYIDMSELLMLSPMFRAMFAKKRIMKDLLHIVAGSLGEPGIPGDSLLILSPVSSSVK